MGYCGLLCVKSLLFVFNFVAWLGGIGLLGVGLIIYFGCRSWISTDDVETILDNNDMFLQYSVFIIIGAGALIFFVGFCGCCGPIMECKHLLIQYILILIILFCGQITAGILVSIYGGNVEEALDDSMIKGFRMTYKNGTKAVVLTEAWRTAEATLDCCGYYSGEDYNDDPDTALSWYKNARKYPDFPDFPSSCCVGASHPDYNANNPTACKASWDADDTRNKDTASYHGKGCRTKLADLTDEYINLIRYGSIGFAVIEIMCIVFAIFVYRNTNERK